MTAEIVPTSPDLPLYARDKDRPYLSPEGKQVDPWLRQKEESPRAYQAFCYFRDQDPATRTKSEASRLYCAKYNVKGLSPNWSIKHRWDERVAAFDNFNDAKIITANRRRAIRVAEKHADQAAAVQDIVMQPIAELRKRLEQEGGTLAAIAELDDVSLLKLTKALAPDLIAAQKAEREALSSTGSAPIPKSQLKAKGAIVRQLLADKTLGSLAEKVAFEIAVEAPDDEDA